MFGEGQLVEFAFLAVEVACLEEGGGGFDAGFDGFVEEEGFDVVLGFVDI